MNIIRKLLLITNSEKFFACIRFNNRSGKELKYRLVHFKYYYLALYIALLNPISSYAENFTETEPISNSDIENNKSTNKTNEREEIRQYVQKNIDENPNLVPESHRESILNGVITLGMTPFEAKLAGGAFAYLVNADRKKWPSGTNPLRILWAQSLNPDDSEITMTFQNTTQYSSEQPIQFSVKFKKGIAVEVIKK